MAEGDDDWKSEEDSKHSSSRTKSSIHKVSIRLPLLVFLLFLKKTCKIIWKRIINCIFANENRDCFSAMKALLDNIPSTKACENTV